jgi:hypothetical protein
VLNIIRKNNFFGFYESFILFTELAIFNCDSVLFFVHSRASRFFGAQFGFFFIILSSLSFLFVNLIECLRFLFYLIFLILKIDFK